VVKGPAATRAAVVGVVWRAVQLPESRVSLLRAGAPSALAAALAAAPPPLCVEALLLCAVPGYDTADGEAPQQTAPVAAAARQVERLARRLIQTPTPDKVQQVYNKRDSFQGWRDRRWIGAVVVGRCSFTPLTPHVDRAWFQCWKLKYDK